MGLKLDSAFKLRGGGRIPVLGLGVFRAEAGGETRAAVQEALSAGYRHIDTARVYGNERDVGAAIRESGVPREEIFVTTKLWNSDHGYDAARRAFDRSLEEMGLERVDLYLLHWPVTGLRHESWRALIELQREGRARAIGVSNFTRRHLEDLAQRSEVVPEVDQIELHPFLRQRDTVEYCERQGIVVEAYSPLAKGTRLSHPVLVEIAKRHGKSPAQVLIRWGLQQGFVVLPKSVKPARIRENADVFGFELDAGDLRRLDELDENLFTGWDSRDVP